MTQTYEQWRSANEFRIPKAELKSLDTIMEVLRAQLAQQASLVEKCMEAMNANADHGEKAEAELAKLRAQPAQKLDCNDCEHAAASEIVGPCADCILHFPERPMFISRVAQPAQEPEDEGPMPNHFCNNRFVHLPHGECCNKCGTWDKA
jgi:hypothetical protein